MLVARSPSLEIFKNKKKTLNKLEILRNKKSIEKLFKQGISDKYGCIQLLCTESTNATLPQILFVVPKSKISKAHMRNKIKRRMREAYRINKDKLISDTGSLPIIIGFIYLQKKPSEYSMIEKSILYHIEWINKKYNTTHTTDTISKHN